MDLTALTAQLVRHEGERMMPYTDTAGKLTIGVGRNLSDRGISQAESRYLLQNDIAEVCAELDQHLPWWRSLGEVRQRALADACFNLGINILLEFHDFLGLLQQMEWEAAADAMEASLWAKQVPMRVADLAQMIRTGEG